MQIQKKGNRTSDWIDIRHVNYVYNMLGFNSRKKKGPEKRNSLKVDFSIAREAKFYKCKLNQFMLLLITSKRL